MKRFCSIVQSYYPTDVRIKKQCDALISNGYSVNVICLRDKGELAYEEVDGVIIHRVNQDRIRASKLRYLFEYFKFFIFTLIKLNQLCLKNNFDIIQVSNLPDFLVFTTFIQKYRGSKIILDLHEILPEFFMSKYNKNENSLTVKCLKLIEKFSLNFADEVITINEMAKRLFNQRSIPEKKITIIMNTIDDSILSKKATKSDSSFNFVYHGTLDPLYGLDIAIEAFNLLNNGNRNFKFYIFGNGRHMKNLEKLILKYGLNDQVLLMGMVPHSEIVDYLSNMDVGILSIRKDKFTDLSFSNKLSEYIHLKIPVISSNLESTKYYFSEEEITYFKSGDPFDLKNKLYFAYKHPHILELKASKAFDKYKSIQWSVMKERYLKLVDSIVS